MNEKDEMKQLIQRKISMYFVLVVLFFVFDFLLSQNKQNEWINQFSFARHRLIYLLVFIAFALVHLLLSYLKMKKRKDKIPEKNSEEYHFLLQKGYNYYEREVALANRKLDFLKEISPFIVTFVFLQGLFEKIFTESIQMEFSEILGFVIVLFYVFVFMETWHTYRIDTGYLLQFKNELTEFDNQKKRKEKEGCQH